MKPTCQDLHLLILTFVSGMMGCVPDLQASRRALADATVSRCHPPFLRPAVSFDISRPQMMATGNQFRARMPRLSEEAQRTAIQIDLLPLLERGRHSDDLEQKADALTMISLRQEISRRIALAASDVMGTIAALDCEASRSDHVADAISEAHQDVSERALFAVFASDIFIGIIPGALMLAGESIAAEASEVFGGVIGTAFGSVDALLHIDQDFQHPNNFLRELWDGPAESRLFPRSVWRFLNDAAEEDPRWTVREQLLVRWETEGRWDHPRAPENADPDLPLLVGHGGRYSERLLRVRAEILRQLASEVLRLGLATHRLKYEILQWLDAEPLASESQSG